MTKKKLVMAIVSSLVILFLAYISQAPRNEYELVSFCNSLKLGQSKKDIISKAKKLGGSSFNQYSDQENRPQLISEGWMYATCNMKFQNEVLVHKQIGVS